MNVEIEIPDELQFPITEMEIREIVETLLKFLLNNNLVYFSLRLVDDKNIQEINLSTRGIHKPTDVLSFPSPQIPSPLQTIGEVIISYDTLFRQAKEIGHSPKDEFFRLLVHGVLHLLGYDHETSKADELEMQSKEDECLEILYSITK
jgi:probable rRNA maturation factor